MSPITAPDISIRFTSGTLHVRRALEQIRAVLRARHIENDLCDTTQIVLGEVLNNVVEHAYNDEKGHGVAVEIWYLDAGLWCRISDRGRQMPNGVPPAGLLPAVDTETREALPEGGFGWALVREMTQDLRYDRVSDANELSFLIPSDCN